jgi:nucleoside-diphosphate-sugar epimerase
MSYPKVLLTGASGFLGTYLHRSLLEAGSSVETLGRSEDSTIRCKLPIEVPHLHAKYDWVIHAMGKAHTQHDAMPPDSFEAVNVTATQHLCNAFESSGFLPEVFVFISTVAVYGLSQGEAIQEDTPLRGGTAYADSKIEAEKWLQRWCHTRGVALLILRLPLVVGVEAPGHLSKMMEAIKRNRFLVIDGGKARKSMIMATDVAAAIPQLVRHPGIFHLTDDEHPSIGQLAKALSHAMKKRPPVSVPLWVAQLFTGLSWLPGIGKSLTHATLLKLTATLTFSNQKVKETIGWKPQPVTEALANELKKL